MWSPVISVLAKSLKRTSNKGYFQSIFVFVDDKDKFEEKNDEEQAVSKNPLVRLVNLLCSSAHKKH